MQEHTDDELRELTKDLVEEGYGEFFYDKNGDLSIRLTPKGRQFGTMLLRQQAYKNN